MIPIADVRIEAGPSGFLGSGSLGEVRKGVYKGVPVALKGLHMLRTDAASQALMGGALNPDERRELVMQFQQECEHMRNCTHANIVPFFGVVVDDTPSQVHRAALSVIFDNFPPLFISVCAAFVWYCI